MNMKSAASLAVMACALESATAFFAATGVATGLTTLEITGLGAGTIATTGATSAALLTGGVLLLKGLAVAGLAIAASRHRRAALAVEEQDAAFAILAASEPAQCYRRLICDLATGGLEKSENDVIVNLFNKDASIESAKFEFVTAAKIGKKHKSVQTCELRYSCPLSGEQIQALF
jgi:hypothetical protein